MQYLYCEASTGERTDTLIESENISIDQDALAQEIGLLLGLEMTAVIVDADPGAGTLTLPLSPLPPDPNGLMLAIFQTFGKAKARSLATKYPDFTIGLDAANWAVARGAVEDAKTAGDLTQENYDTLQQFTTDYHIPLE